MRKIFINGETGRLRSGWQVLIFASLFLAGSTLARKLLQLLGIAPETGSLLHRMVQVLVLLGVSALCARWLAGRPPGSVGYSFRPRWYLELGLGFGISLAMVLTVALIQDLAGGTRFSWDVDSWQAGPLGTTALGLLLSGIGEELMFRGFPLQALAASLRPAGAAVLVSVLFGMVHLKNPESDVLAVANTILAGLWLSAAYFRTRALWLPTGLHVGWNLSLVLCGLTVSGFSLSHPSPVHAIDLGPSWLTGDGYGPEGGLVATFALALAAYALVRYPTRELNT